MAPLSNSSCRANAACMARALFSQSLVEPSMSVNRKVRVPVGGLATTLSPPCFPKEDTIAVEPSLDPLFAKPPHPAPGPPERRAAPRRCVHKPVAIGYYVTRQSPPGQRVPSSTRIARNDRPAGVVPTCAKPLEGGSIPPLSGASPRARFHSRAAHRLDNHGSASTVGYPELDYP